jgi:hypothetical protein
MAKLSVSKYKISESNHMAQAIISNPQLKYFTEKNYFYDHDIFQTDRSYHAVPVPGCKYLT